MTANSTPAASQPLLPGTRVHLVSDDEIIGTVVSATGLRPGEVTVRWDVTRWMLYHIRADCLVPIDQPIIDANARLLAAAHAWTIARAAIARATGAQS
jgi:hypothetical protein